MERGDQQWRKPDQKPRDDSRVVQAEAVPEPVESAENTTPAQEPTPNIDENQVVRWQAAEYIHRDKDAVWYIVFTVVVLVLMALAFFLFKSITFVILIPVMAAALVVYSRRPPVQLEYTLSRKGLHVNDRLYEYDQFKEFGLLHGDDQNSILLVPRARFKPGVTIYFPDEVGEAVVDMLAARLPMHEAQIDLIDRLIKKLRI